MLALRKGRLASRGLGIATAGLALSLGMTSAASAAPAGVGGGAFGVSADVTALGVHVVVGQTPSVTLPTPGGSAVPLTSHLASLAGPPVFSAGVLDVSTVGTPAGGTVLSSADVANLSVPPLLLTSGVIHSSCSATGAGAGGTTTLVGLTIGTTVVAANPGIGTVIPIAGVATVTLNEQIPTTTLGLPGITVNAVHIRLLPGLGSLGSGDIIVSQSRCDLIGSTPVPVGAIGGVVLTGVLGVLFAGYQFRKRRETA